jgi:hypothetical protein
MRGLLGKTIVFLDQTQIFLDIHSLRGLKIGRHPKMGLPLVLTKGLSIHRLGDGPFQDRATRPSCFASLKRLSKGIPKSGCLGIPDFILRRNKSIPCGTDCKDGAARPAVRSHESDWPIRVSGSAPIKSRVRRSSVDEIFDFPELARHLAGNKCKGRLTFVSAFKSVESLWHGVDSSPETLHGNLETRHPASIPARQGELRKTQQEPTLRRKVR